MQTLNILSFIFVNSSKIGPTKNTNERERFQVQNVIEDIHDFKENWRKKLCKNCVQT
jgi:hypothetical protein